MKRILGLDISSATIGWALIEEGNGEIVLIKKGHISPPSKKKSKDNIALRLNYAFEEITLLVEDLEPDVVAIEDYAKKFSKGRSSANTIIILSSFNEVCGLAAYRVTDKKPVRISVSRLRALVKKEYSQNIKDKEDVLAFCREKFKNFSTQKNRVGNIKKECYDEADALIVCIGYHLEIKSEE